MIHKILTRTGLLIPLFMASQAAAHPDFIPHAHPHAYSDYTSAFLVLGMLGLLFASIAILRRPKRKKVRK